MFVGRGRQLKFFCTKHLPCLTLIDNSNIICCNANMDKMKTDSMSDHRCDHGRSWSLFLKLWNVGGVPGIIP